jgi:hypothetical protein
MFQHITVLFSFVFAIAMTHVLSCVSKLILGARPRALLGLARTLDAQCLDVAADQLALPLAPRKYQALVGRRALRTTA